MLSFRKRLPLEQRKVECRRVLLRHPGYVPAILERGNDDAPRIDREKFLLPRDLTAAQLHFVVRRRLKMGPSEALFLLCHGCTLGGNDYTVGQLHETRRDEDGFLYICYTLEHTFG